jgi:CopA family copper-resistance protein
MDGVPGLTFAGIPPGGTYRYQFKVRQSGTYWYHSHSGFQEQTGMYGPIIIDPAGPDPVGYDREYVLLLSDWTDEAPRAVFERLKKQSHYYQAARRTLFDVLNEVRADGMAATLKDRGMWNLMRMSDRDLSDVTGHTYSFFMNGALPEPGWSGLFAPGERVRLRFINGSAMTFFDIRIPGLDMTVVAADGQNVEPVTVEEFRLGVAETCDVVVRPHADSAYTIFAQAIDRSGYARGTLAPAAGMTAPVPDLDPVPELTHADMGMGHDSQPAAGGGVHALHGTGSHAHGGQGIESSATVVRHAPSEFGPGVDMRAEAPALRLHDPGPGLRGNGRRVLVYGDLVNLGPTPDPREPEREIELHLTGNMSRYMWSFDGISFHDADPIPASLGERLRVTLVNDTMMNHPIHLHGMWSDLETGDLARIPRKHTVVVQPGSKISFRASVDAPGDWAFHCHLLYHMAGMFRTVAVS